MNQPRPLTIGVIAGEESGDLLGADLVRALQAGCGREVRLVGVGGRHLQALGLQTLFDPSEIMLMGVASVIGNLPKLLLRIRQAASAIADAVPDCLLTIDVPDFSLRVAKRVKAARPEVPTVHYVCPSVWAWRPGRAPAMRSYVDHVLCLLPFEPAELKRLGGPAGTYVGHRLATDPLLAEAAQAQADRRRVPGGRKTLLLLPGSRRGEVSALIEPFGRTVAMLAERGNELRLVLPTVPHVEARVRGAVAGWALRPEIVTGTEDKYRAFAEADAALIASGTVSLELGLAGVPMISCYRLDWLSTQIFINSVPVWSALLPNLICDRMIAPEFFNERLRPQSLVRAIEPLLADTSARAWQVEGLAELRRRMATDRPSGEIAADVVRKAVGSRQ